MITQKSLYDDLIPKRKLLEKARRQLKKEFIGINSAIDQVVDLASSWYLFPGMQTRPVIACLWGLTGIGKSSLVKRFVELIDFTRRSFTYELNSCSRISFEDIEQISSQEGEKNFIISLDEFQHLPRNSRNQPDGIWELLDSGLLKCNSYPTYYFRMFKLLSKLQDAIFSGVKVYQGVCIEGNRIYGKIVHDEEDPIDEEQEVYFFFPPNDYEYLLELCPDLFSYEYQVKDMLLTLDGPGTVDFLKRILREQGKPKIIDCSKALIFVLGNLDSAYTMAQNFSPDLSADEFNRISLQINLSHIKNALLASGFRSEQIARLGNNHIIYPSFTCQSYQDLIKLELTKIYNSFRKEFDIALSFDDTLLNLIYREGVFPTQGTRPVFSTIYNVVSSKLGKVLEEVLLKKIEPTEIIVCYKEENVVFVFMARKRLLHIYRITQPLTLEKIRKNRCDDVQAITAVHESGHALLSMVLLKTIPDSIFSVTADSNAGGFVHTNIKWDYLPKNQIVMHAAMMLGGYVAEILVFGNENATAGSEGDIKQATEFVMRVIKSSGLGNTHYYFQTPAPETNYAICDLDGSVNNEAKKLLDFRLRF